MSVSFATWRISDEFETFENTARQSWWPVHVEAWRESGLDRTNYCRQNGLWKCTFDRWLNYLAGQDAARKHAEYQAELRPQRRHEAQEKRQKRRARLRFAVSTDERNRALQAFWAIHVEAMNWSGVGVREYAAALQLSPHRCANGATGWTMSRKRSTGGLIFIPPPGRRLALVPEKCSPKAR